MIDSIARCEWSDLPARECAHCPGSTTFSAPRLEPVEARGAAAAGSSASDVLRRHLPVLGNVSEYAQPDIHDMVNELTRDHGHRERYTVTDQGTTWNRNHITDVPALVHQLLGATPGGSKDESGAGSPKSKPAARIEAIDTLMLIDDEAARWVRRLGENDPGDEIDPTTGRPVSGTGTIACIRRLHGLHPGQESCGRAKPRRDLDTGGRPICCTQHAIEHDVRRWWHQARIITGWDSPAYRPHNTCPVCEQLGALRINLAAHAGFCVECRSVWGPDEIGLLAEHIRDENAEDDTPTDTDESA